MSAFRDDLVGSFNYVADRLADVRADLDRAKYATEEDAKTIDPLATAYMRGRLEGYEGLEHMLNSLIFLYDEEHPE